MCVNAGLWLALHLLLLRRYLKSPRMTWAHTKFGPYFPTPDYRLDPSVQDLDNNSLTIQPVGLPVGGTRPIRTVTRASSRQWSLTRDRTDQQLPSPTSAGG